MIRIADLKTKDVIDLTFEYHFYLIINILKEEMARFLCRFWRFS